MYQETFVNACRRTNSHSQQKQIVRNNEPIYVIFNTVCARSDMKNIYQFQDISRIFTRVRSCTDGQIDRQTDKLNAEKEKYIKIFLNYLIV